MKSRYQQKSPWKLENHDGKGKLGCVFSLLFLGAVIFAGIQFLPPYYAEKSFETDVKAELARAGANFFDDETVLKNILSLAGRNEIRLSRDNVKIERFAGQLVVTIRYSVAIDFYVYQMDMPFEIKASSYIGRL